MAISDLISEIKDVLRDEFGEEPDGLAGAIDGRDRSRLEAAIGRPIPEQLAALLNIHNGESQAASSFLLEGAWLMPASTIEADYKSHVENAARQNLLDVADSTNFVASGSVYPSLWRSGWIPFMEVAKSPWAIDLDPCQGEEGQVISVQIENGVVVVEAPSIEGLLSRYLDSLRGGVREFLAAF